MTQLATNPPAVRETWVPSMCWEDPLEREKANYFSILSWRGQSMELQKVEHDWVIFTLTLRLYDFSILRVLYIFSFHQSVMEQSKKHIDTTEVLNTDFDGALMRKLTFIFHGLVAQSRPTFCDPVDCSPPGSSVQGNFPGKNTEVGCHALFQM